LCVRVERRALAIGENGGVRVAILGPFEVSGDGGGQVVVAGARLRDLVIRLALAGGKPVSTSALAEAVWGDEPPADLPNALQTLVSRARRALGGADAVQQSAAGYRLAVSPDDVDALRFERLVADGDVGEALALWRGPALEDAGDFAAPYALRLTELKLDATLTWLGEEVAGGAAAAHVAGLEALAAENPLNEKVAALLMRALAATGRQAKALAVYEAARTRLVSELGIDPGADLRAAHLEVLRGKVPREGNGRPGHVRTNLRAHLTSFVGREDDANRVGQALDSSRLVTLVGPGGAGKTRLASEVAARIAAKSVQVDGVWMAELASVTDAADIPQAVLGSIGLRESRLMPDGSQRVTRDARTRLMEGLANVRALLVLDNCEHLIDACARLADVLLAHSPRLRIVATSREPLGITGESLFVVPPLAQDPAVRLFADRAAAVSSGFTVDEENLPFVVEIVRRLDGLPLAIELAAARLRTLPLAEISRRLNDRFRLLTAGSRTALPRHRTLRAVVEWSWDLLAPAERLLAERFSVFPGGATREAVAAVCGDLGDIDELVSSLLDKSLLQAVKGEGQVGGGTRVRMLETIREYGAEKLAERGETGEVAERHAEYYGDLMTTAGPKLVSPEQLSWLRIVQDDRDNILAALHYWCAAENAARAVAMAVNMCGVAFMLGNHADITDWIAQAIAVPGESDPNLRTVAEAMYMITQTLRIDDMAGTAPDHPFPGLDDRVEALDVKTMPLAGLLRPAYAMFTHDNGRIRRYLDEALSSEDEWLVAGAWMFSAAFAENTGDMDVVRTASAQALERFRALGERWGLSNTLRLVGGIQIIDGDLDGAADSFAEAGRALREMGSREDESHLMLRLAEIAVRRGDIDKANELFEAAARVAAEQDGSPSDISVVAAGSAMFAIGMGEIELARSRNAAAQEGLDRLSQAHPARHHMASLVAASGLMIALNDGDLQAARERAVSAYQAAMLTDDMPIVALVGGTLARFAHTLGQSERAARMLGACTPVRGGEDATEPLLTGLRPELCEVLGEEEYTRAYEEGKALDRAEALALLDPARLLRAPGISAHRERDEHGQQTRAPDERPSDLRAGWPPEHQATYGADQVRERVHFHERLQPAGHGCGPHERIASERQRHNHQEHHALNRSSSPHHHANEDRDPREREREADRYGQRGEELQRVGRDAEAQRVAEPDRDRADNEVTREFRQHRTDQRYGTADRQRSEPVEDALGDVGVHVLPDGDAAHGDRLAEQPRQQELQVLVLRAAAERAAEHVGEQQQEDDRLQRDIEELLGRAEHLDRVALG
jgi:predicted ATPase/DNA-binding SARP family transcriptional activator